MGVRRHNGLGHGTEGSSPPMAPGVVRRESMSRYEMRDRFGGLFQLRGAVQRVEVMPGMVAEHMGDECFPAPSSFWTTIGFPAVAEVACSSRRHTSCSLPSPLDLARRQRDSFHPSRCLGVGRVPSRGGGEHPAAEVLSHPFGILRVLPVPSRIRDEGQHARCSIPTLAHE